MKFFSLFSSSPFYVVDSDLCWFHGDNQKQTDSGKCPEPSATWWRGLAGGYCHSGWLAAPRLATTRDRSGAPRAPPWPCVTPTLGAPPTHPIHRTHTRSLRMFPPYLKSTCQHFFTREDTQHLQWLPKRDSLFQCPWNIISSASRERNALLATYPQLHVLQIW